MVFGINAAHKAPITFDGNRIENGKKLLAGIDLNGAKGNISATNNVNADVATVAYVASGYPDVATGKLSFWGSKAPLAPDMHAIQYAVGDLVMFDAELYRAKTASTGLEPASHAEAWEKLPLPADDLRVDASSPYAEMGVR